ncbi:MAG TPA: recombination regulator RecX [Candidatus Avanaerovorax faecigallinarum]|nr:recombination regulator RecX [Candidatus Avanaerovorax faecigallinarum]
MNAYDAGAKYVASRSRTVSEVRKHLKDKGFEPGEIETVISDFTDYGYLDDCRYSADFAAYGAGKGWSDRRIIAELEKRGVSPETGRDGLTEYVREGGKSEADRAFAAALSIVRSADILSREEFTEKVKSRVGRRLASYGYSSGVFYETLRRIERYLEKEN